MIWLLWVAAALLGAAAVVHFWEAIREWVASALRNAHLERSQIMDAWIRLDSIATGVRARFYARQQRRRVTMVEETLLSQDQIDDEEVLEELRRRGEATRNVMDYLV